MRRTCLDMVHELAKADPRIVFIGSDLGAGTLDAMKEEMPDRFFMEGIAEQNLIGVAAGLALEGFIPYVNTIATFITRRCFEQVCVDLCLHKLPVRLIGNGGGLVYAPLGPTHTAIEDISIMRSLPNMSVVAPADAEEMRRFMATTPDYPGPLYIRLAKGGDPVVTRDEDGFTIGKAIRLREGGEVAFMTTGVMTKRALDAAEILAERGIDCSVTHFHTVKPLDDDAALEIARNARLVVTVEENVGAGGLGSAVTDTLIEGLGTAMPQVRRLALPDAFPENYGSQDGLLELYGLHPAAIVESVLGSLSRAAAE